MPTPRWLRLPEGTKPHLAYGGDYNPEQWPREVWRDDVRLMREAGVTIVSLAIFSWARLQPAEDRWDFDWLDEVMDLLHGGGIAVDLATATASPPPWLTAAYPEILPVTAEGLTVWPGSRQHWRPTSPVFRRHALRLAETMARRYGDHPALAAWHVSNELGCHNIYDYSDDAAGAFRDWLRNRYGTVESLNDAWGTAFWSQRYTDFEQILPPRLAASYHNPTQCLDFRRFSSDALLEYLNAEAEVLRAITPEVPLTTNFMVMGDTNGMNYAQWAGAVDFVANDHYLQSGPRGADELSFSANLVGNLSGGAPWFLMEHAPSAVNWQPVNRAKQPGELARDALLHVGHGADAVCFFQWRQSTAGAEKYHSAMLPHAGEDSEVFRAVAELGSTLAGLGEIAGTRRRPATAAILFDWESWWTSEGEAGPTARLSYRSEALDWYSAFLALGVRADVIPRGAPFDDYTFLVAPVLHAVPEQLAKQLADYVGAGGHLVTTYFSGIVDENDHAWLGGYPGPLRDLLGIRIDEFAPLLDDETVRLSDGSVGSLWSDRIEITGDEVEVLASYLSGMTSGMPAITRRVLPSGGSAAYVSTRLGAEGLVPLLRQLLDAADVASELPVNLRGRVELAIRTDGGADYWFLVNRGDEPIPLRGTGGDLLTPVSPAGGTPVLGPRAIAVVRLPAGAPRGTAGP